MSNRIAKIYAENNVHTSVVSANSGQIILLIYERIFDHLKLGKQALENGKYAIESFTKAHDLIQQGLLSCLDYDEGGDISQSLAAVYEWSLREIISARATKSAEKIQGVIDVLTPLYEAWLALAPKAMINHLSVDDSMARSEEHTSELQSH